MRRVQCAWGMAAQVPLRPSKGQALDWLLLGTLLRTLAWALALVLVDEPDWDTMGHSPEWSVTGQAAEAGRAPGTLDGVTQEGFMDWEAPHSCC